MTPETPSTLPVAFAEDVKCCGRMTEKLALQRYAGNTIEAALRRGLVRYESRTGSLACPTRTFYPPALLPIEHEARDIDDQELARREGIAERHDIEREERP